MDIVCPSGLAGTVRALKVVEARNLADKQQLKAGGVTSSILKACWTDTADPGPLATDRLDWDEALSADRFYAMMMIRVATYGGDFDFDAFCPRCEAKVPWTVDLRELPVKPVPEETIAHLKGIGNDFPLTIAGKEARFALPTGASERKASKLLLGTKNQAERMEIAIAARLLSVEGENSKRRFLQNLSMADFMQIVDAMDAADGGVETDVSIECGECSHVFEVPVPFDDQGAFWMPRRTKQAPRRPTTPQS